MLCIISYINLLLFPEHLPASSSCFSDASVISTSFFSSLLAAIIPYQTSYNLLILIFLSLLVHSEQFEIQLKPKISHHNALQPCKQEPSTASQDRANGSLTLTACPPDNRRHPPRLPQDAAELLVTHLITTRRAEPFLPPENTL